EALIFSMNIYDLINGSGVEGNQKALLEQFFQEIHWIEKEFSFDRKISHKELMEKVNQYTRSLFETREQFISVMNIFIDYIIDSDFLETQKTIKKGRGKSKYKCQVDKIYDSVEMKVKLLKFLQGTKDGKRRTEIANHFNISLNSIDKRLTELQSRENHILGTKVQIELERSTNSYNSTVHPIFLTLNLSELYMLLGILKRQEKSIAGNEVRKIITDIVSQLIDYAKGILKNSGIDMDGYVDDETRSFRNESSHSRLINLMKSGNRIILHLYAETTPRIGVLKHNTTSNKEFLFKPDNGDPIYLDSAEIKEVVDLFSIKSVYFRS
ncbi:MAG: hypothetical protein Q8T08_12390, partial [Ignavibacteria bacterium]|nr:hypothetical protein [Ignavibacteria bacterium]